MPRTKIKPNPQLKQIVLEETNDGRDVVRYLKSVFMEVEDAPRLFGLSPKEYARTHKIAAARILARIGLEEGKRYLRRTYVQTPFRRIHPEEEDLPKRDMAASTADLYRLVKKETNDGRDIIIRFVGIMKGFHPEYKPHLRMAAARELIRQIEFDYGDEPSPSGSDAAAEPTASQANPVHPASDEKPADTPNPIDNSKLTIENSHIADPIDDADPIDNSHTAANPIPDPPPRPHHDYAGEHCAPEEESIYRSIIRRASDRPDLDSAKREAQRLVEEFNSYALDRNPEHRTVVVPDDLLARSLSQRMDTPETYIFDPADYYHLDRDDFYYCLCRDCDECDEIEFFIECMEELEEETDPSCEDP